MKRKAFTLVEILIVVIILGILAAIVIPQFTEASNDARDSALVSDLQTLRSSIELYKVQHGETLPTTDIVAQLTGTTDFSGDTSGTGFGPYLQKFPTNPYNNKNDVTTTGNWADDLATGWHYTPSTGVILPVVAGGDSM